MCTSAPSYRTPSYLLKRYLYFRPLLLYSPRNQVVLNRRCMLSFSTLQPDPEKRYLALRDWLKRLKASESLVFYDYINSI
jgi:hypothetical protein